MIGAWLLLAGCGGAPAEDSVGATDTDADVDADADGDADTDADTDTDTSTSPVGCTEGGFASPAADWGLPGGWGTDAFARTGTTTERCTSGQDVPAWVARDLDGDGVADLVVTDDCDDDVVGTAVWFVHAGTGSAFDGDPAYWSLPSGYGEGAFANPGGAAASCGGDIPAWILTDLTGDGRPDLVVTADCDDGTVGSSAWRVFVNTGTGFASTGSSWRLPSGYGTGAFGATAATSEDCTAAWPAFTLLDLTADGRDDLVVTDACDDDVVGTSAWRVYPSSGSGFASTPTDWSLPSGFSVGAFQRGYGPAASCDGGNDWPAWTARDLDGDGRLDLVATSICDEATIGTSAWRLYRNDGAGFAAAGTTWELPAYGAGAFAGDAADAPDCETSAPAWTLVDLTADGRPDVVVTAVCDDGAVGSATWRVHVNRGDGFAGTPIGWLLPNGYSSGAFAHATNTAPACGGADTWPAFQLADPDGDGFADVLVTDDCADASVGTRTWWRFAGSCR